MKKTEIFALSSLKPEELSYIAKALLNGASAVIPTDTVYGLIVCGKPGFLRILNEVKKNPPEKPSQILCSWEQALLLSEDCPGLKAALKFWPGPLTAILPASCAGKKLSGLDTVGLRVPGGALAAQLFKLTNCPLYASSANMHSLPTLEKEEEVLSVFEGKADIIIKGGFLKAGPSSVIDFTCRPPQMLRRGALKDEELEILLYKS